MLKRDRLWIIKTIFTHKMNSSLLIMHTLLKSLHDPKRLEKELLNRSDTSQFINVKDEHGDSLLHFAARSHSLEILRILVEHGANPESVNEHGNYTRFPI
jgi:ankyrin repeat protein